MWTHRSVLQENRLPERAAGNWLYCGGLACADQYGPTGSVRLETVLAIDQRKQAIRLPQAASCSISVCRRFCFQTIPYEFTAGNGFNRRIQKAGAVATCFIARCHHFIFRQYTRLVPVSSGVVSGYIRLEKVSIVDAIKRIRTGGRPCSAPVSSYNIN